MRFPHKAYDEMIAAEKAAQIQPVYPEKKEEEKKKEESVFDDPEKKIISEPDPEPETDPEGGADDDN